MVTPTPGARVRRRRGPGRRCGRNPADGPRRARRDGQHHRRARRHPLGPARTPQGPRPTDPRCLSTASSGGGDPVDARFWTRPGRFAAGRGRRLEGVSHRRTSGRSRGAGTSPERLWTPSGEPAQAEALQPTATACALPLSPDLDDARRSKPGLLPQEAQPRPHPQPSRHRPGPPKSRHPVGPTTRQPHLDPHPTSQGRSSSGSTSCWVRRSAKCSAQAAWT